MKLKLLVAKNIFSLNGKAVIIAGADLTQTIMFLKERPNANSIQYRFVTHLLTCVYFNKANLAFVTFCESNAKILTTAEAIISLCALRGQSAMLPQKNEHHRIAFDTVVLSYPL